MKRVVTRASQIVAILGALSLAAGLALPQRAVVLAALASSWLFFAGASAGGVALAAAIRIAQGRWAKGVLPLADAASAFFGPSLGILALLVLTARLWIPWAAHASLRASLGVAARDLVSGVILYAVGRRLVRAARAGKDSMPLAVAYVLLYAVVLSLWAVDLVMSLHDWAPSTAIPAYYFMGSLVTGLAWVAFVSCALKEAALDADGRHDAGKLLFGLTTFLAYLLWSIYLPTWYTNVPDEAGQLLARWQAGYRPLSMVVLTLGFLVPFVVLMTEGAKRNRAALGAGAASVLVGLFVERFLLVLPSLELVPSPLCVLLAAGTVAGVGGLFILTFGAELSKHPSVLWVAPLRRPPDFSRAPPPTR